MSETIDIDRIRSVEGMNSVYEEELLNETVKKERDPSTKPFQELAWVATVLLIFAASMASFFPTVDMFFDLPGKIHHWAFTVANGLWVLTGVLWREKSLIVLNAGLTIIYIVPLLV